MTLPLPTELFDKQKLITNPVELITYEIDAGFDRAKPDAVFYPEEAADLSRLLRWANQHAVPIVARGAGTGLAGGAVAEQGGIVVTTAKLNRILAIDPRGRTAHVEAGAVNLAVDAAVKQHGLYYPPDPASGRSSVIGGNIGTNAGGPHCFKYGVTTNYVMGVRMVLADGAVVQLGGPVYDSPEYDLLGVVVGGEGTLGMVVDAHLRLIANPPGVRTMMVSFASEAMAGKAVSAVIAAGLVPATLELMDQRSMRMIEEFTGAGLPVDAGAALIVEVDGYPESLDTQIEEVADLLQANGGADFHIAQSEEERQRIWYGRKSAAGAFSRLAPSYYLTDVTVRRSLLGEVLADILAVCDKHDVRTANFFHAGDGNLHPLILCDVRDAELMTRVHQAGKEIIDICLAHDGSITGEHGIGMEKRGYMAQMYAGAELAVMAAVKAVFDPNNICNPGKVLPAELPPPQRATPRPTLPTSLCAPQSADEAAALLAACTNARQPVHIVGGSDRTAHPHTGDELILSTAALTGIHTFAPDDLYVTVGAGTRLDELHAFLAAHNMQAPIQSPWPETSAGALVSANANAPLRLRYASLRDVMLCATVALADGSVIRAGRPLVKNVAGYDLAKLFVGAYGTLGLLTDVTFKLTPTPRARRTLAMPVHDALHGARVADALLPGALLATAVVLVQQPAVAGVDAPWLLLYSVEGLAEDVAAELAAVTAQARHAGASAIIEIGETGLDSWAAFLRQTSAGECLVRVGVPASQLTAWLKQIPTTAQTCIDCGAGLVYLRLPAQEGEDWSAQLATVRTAARACQGYAIVLAAPTAAVTDAMDPWGRVPSALGVMQRLKARLDPAGILNPQVFVV